jgi:glutamine cyclotransferase
MPLPSLRWLILLSLWTSAATAAFAADTYRVIHAYPHDPHAFTQGLIYLDGHLYESTGLNGQSTLRMDDLETGRILQRQEVPSQYFAEGLTNWAGTLVQLTWETHIAFVYDPFSFRVIKTLNYVGEGWGLTQDGKNLIQSDGSSTLRFLDPKSLHITRTITVKDHGAPVTQINELEYIHGQIYANIWHTDKIARISPASGKVLDWIDLTGLLPADERSSPEAVLNGIAYDATHNRLFVTGKLWPTLFEIKIIPQPAKSAK